jgi:hypothetical protein
MEDKKIFFCDHCSFSGDKRHVVEKHAFSGFHAADELAMYSLLATPWTTRRYSSVVTAASQWTRGMLLRSMSFVASIQQMERLRGCTCNWFSSSIRARSNADVLVSSESERPWPMAENNGKRMALTNLHLLHGLCRMS